MDEMEKRGYHPDEIWRKGSYRGKILNYQDNWYNQGLLDHKYGSNLIIYPEHNDEYLKECLENLKSKGIEINV